MSGRSVGRGLERGLGRRLDQRVGPMRLRGWLLVVNLVCNALALYGLSRVMVTGGGTWVLVLGVLGTVACFAVLAQPSGEGSESEAG